MSGTFPDIAPSTVSLSSNSPTRVSVTQSLNRSVRSSTAHRWTIALNFPNLRMADYLTIQAFMLSQRGRYGSFDIVLAGYTQPRGTWSGTPQVNGASQTGLNVNLSGFTPSETGVAKAGDIIKFSNSNKVYMVTTDANSDGSGNATIALNTYLVTPPVSGSDVVFSNVPFHVADVSDEFGLQVSAGMVASIDLKFEEVL